MVNTSHTRTHVSTYVKGTFGYLDPTYFLARRLTKKLDVYAFGVVLFEVLCARPPIDTNQIIDPYLTDKIAPECLKEYVKNVENCMCVEGIERPSMDDLIGLANSYFNTSKFLANRKKNNK
ncbi:hypothetical protein ACSBR2_024896 [Camellia fascicularis]